MRFPKKLVETTILTITALLLLGLVYLGWKTNQFSEANNFAGSLTPLLSFFGSVLVFFAFKAQVKANKKIQEQFQQTHILTLIERLNSRIINSTLIIDHESYSGYSIFDKLLRNLRDEQRRILDRSAIGIFTSIPNEIDIAYYRDFLCSFSDLTMFDEKLDERAENLKTVMIEQGIQTPKYLYDNYDINKEFDSASDNNFKSRSYFRENLYCRYFYNMDGEYRINLYDLSFEEFNGRFDIFLDSYFKSTFALLDAVIKFKKRKPENIEYLKNVFTNQEKILLFHKFMTGKTTRQFGMYLIELGIFDMRLDRKYFAVPYGIDRYSKDIEYIKPLVYK